MGNKFVDGVVNNTIGYIFHGNATWKGLGENLKGLFVAKNGQFGDSVAQTLGTVAAVYNLGNATVANKAGDVKLHYGEKPSAKYTFKDEAGKVFATIW